MVSADERWIEAWRQRDRLLRIARRRLPTREDAEDVVAEAIQRAGAQTDLPVEAVAAWTTRVTTNLCVDRLRRLAVQRAALQRAELRPEPLPTHEEDVTSRAEAAWLAERIEQLPPRQALAVRLRGDGIGNSEIAELLAVSPASVDALLKRSRAALRSVLRAAGALVAALLASGTRDRRPAAVVLAGAAVLVALLPWTGDPARPIPQSPPPVELPAAAAPVAAGTLRAALPDQTTAGSAGVEPGAASPSTTVGRARPYDGPRCLVAYCLPIVDDAADRTLGATAPKGWSPADLWDYLGEPSHAPSAAARRPLVAIVAWYEFDWVVPDLARYRDTFQLPPCGTDDGCLQVLPVAAESGSDAVTATSLGAYHSAYSRMAGIHSKRNTGAEQSVMLQSVSAACPECRLALVVARSDHMGDVVAAFRRVQELQPTVVVTNLAAGISDGTGDVLHDPDLYTGTLMVAGGGVGGHRTSLQESPRRFPHVISVGGTLVEGGRVVGHPENASFCDTSIPRPSWQGAFDTGCGGRAGMDVTVPAGEGTGLAVLISRGLPDGRGWYHPGHETQAVAMFGGMLARHGLDRVVRGPADLYAHPEWFTDITAGSSDCRPTGCTYDAATSQLGCTPTPQLCGARRGWDGVTGLGEPRNLPWY